jgi:hypothetical protein
MNTTVSLLASARTTLEWVSARFENSLGRVLGRAARTLNAFETCRVPVPVPIPTPRRPRVSLSALAVFALAIPALAGSARADVASRYADVADGRLVDVRVLVDGRNAPLFWAPRGGDKRYFQAFKGRNYALSIRNTTGRRIGVLIAVDGLNVVNGERSRLSSRETMYVLDPYESATIRGWRTSLDDVRKFVFVDEERSYAERTGQANGDMGWIRVLAFRENAPQVWGGRLKSLYRGDEVGGSSDERARQEAAPPSSPREGKAAPEATRDYAGNENESNPGTGWGERGYDPVQRTHFVAESRATDQIVLRYEYASGLRALGINPWQSRDRIWQRERGELGFAQPPGR